MTSSCLKTSSSLKCKRNMKMKMTYSCTGITITSYEVMLCWFDNNFEHNITQHNIT